MIAEACPSGYREMLLFAAGTGFRIEDLCEAGNYQYDRDGGTLCLHEKKTDKWRDVPVPQWLREDFAAFDGRHEYRSKLFESDGRRITRQTAWRWIRRAFREYGGSTENGGISPHSLRKCYAVQKRLEGHSLAEVSTDLNHNSKSTTIPYFYADQIDAAEDLLP